MELTMEPLVGPKVCETVGELVGPPVGPADGRVLGDVVGLGEAEGGNICNIVGTPQQLSPAQPSIKGDPSQHPQKSLS
jgi:hypothetical protein